MNVIWTNTNKNAYMYRYIMHIWTPIIEPFEAADSSGKKFNARLVSNLNFPETNISTCMKAAPEEKMATMMTMNGLVFVCVRIIQALVAGKKFSP